jgi:hypothetical protein
MALADAVYKGLRPQERVRATVAAMARGDEDEQRRLMDTCPHKAYTMADARFVWPLKGLAAMSAAHHALRLQLMANFVGSLFVGAAVKPESEGFVASQETADTLHETTVSVFKAREEAWSAFCAHVGIGTADAAAMVGRGFGQSCMEITAERFMNRDETPADEEVRNQYFDSLMNAWEEMNSAD